MSNIPGYFNTDFNRNLEARTNNLFQHFMDTPYNGPKLIIRDIFSAIKSQDIAEINKFLNDSNIYDTNDKNETLMDVAVQVGNVDIINLLLEREKDSFIHIGLPAAIQNENIQLIKLLLEKGANVNRISRKTNQSPLMQAINQQNEDIIELLLKFKANIRTNENPPLFQTALKIGESKIIKMLIEKIADINELENGKSLLQMAIDENNIKAIVFLLKKGADPRNDLNRLREVAKKNDVVDIVLENVLLNFNVRKNEEKTERKTNKTETK